MSELDRRDFLKLVGASAGAAAAAGCSDPVEKLIPYVVEPDGITPGIAVEYASTCRECPIGCGLHVKTREGRPIKLEGNPDHPINQGALCARGQAGIGRTYHPDRIAGPISGGAEVEWDAAQQTFSTALKNNRGKVWVLGSSRGPTVDGIIDSFVKAAGGRRVVYEAFDGRALRKATEAVFGVAATPIFDLSKADLIIDVGSDFLDTGLSPTEHSRQFAAARDVKAHPDGGTRLVAITPRLTLTASSADKWVEARPGSEIDVVRAIGAAALAKRGATGSPAARALGSVDLGAAATASGVDRKKLEAVVDKLAKAKNPVVLPPGVALSSERATGAAAAVMLLNAALGAVGTTVQIPAAADAVAPSGLAGVKQLVDAMKAGQVGVLIVHDANPVYSLPAELGFADALAKVGLVVSTASLKDETSEAAGLVLPDHTPLESWGDAAPRQGIRSLQQPTVRPLMNTMPLGDTLLAAGRAAGFGGLPEGDTKGLVEKNWNGDFRAALAVGGSFAPTSRTAQVSPNLSGIRFDAPKLRGNGDYTLVAYPHSFFGDGKGAALPWLQEVPDPVTKITWRSWVEVSKATAEKLGVDNGDVVKLEAGGQSVEAPAYVRGGIRDDVIAVAIGQGHTVGGYASESGEAVYAYGSASDEYGGARGVNIASLLPAASDEAGGRAWLSTTVSAQATGGYQRLPMTQWTDDQHNRGLAQQVSLLALAEGDDHHGDDHGGGHHELLRPYEIKNDAHPDEPYRWGMTIDNDKCNGCSACIVACYIENNVPVVGEEQVLRHREMTWLRIERYIGDGTDDYSDGEERRPQPDLEVLGETDVRHAPMLCQQCGAAPCESVCPVIATYHSPDGINGMVYNRCVGTRYCANNCTYKVRRFNYWDYGQQNFPGLLGMMLNPDVTVRGQGVMEKCNFCYQRIQAARQPAKDEGRLIADGEVVTACQQSCPSGAISFGNTREAGAEVNQQADQPKRAYHSLHILNTRPAITYLSQVDRDGAGHHDKHEGNHG